MRCGNCARFVEKQEQMFKRQIVTSASGHQNDRFICSNCIEAVDAALKEQNAALKEQKKFYAIFITIFFVVFFSVFISILSRF